MTWRHWTVRPHYGARRDTAREFYAPTLMDAFALARSEWPSATTWECLGSSPDGTRLNFPATLTAAR